MNTKHAEFIARLKLAQVLLEAKFEGMKLHTEEYDRVQHVIWAIQQEVDAVYKDALYEVQAQLDGGLIPYESFIEFASALQAETFKFGILKIGE